jgi:hypothetical protein
LHMAAGASQIPTIFGSVSVWILFCGTAIFAVAAQRITGETPVLPAKVRHYPIFGPSN